MWVIDSWKMGLFHSIIVVSVELGDPYFNQHVIKFKFVQVCNFLCQINGAQNVNTATPKIKA